MHPVKSKIESIKDMSSKSVESEPRTGDWLVRNPSDEMRNNNSSDVLIRGLATKVSGDRAHEQRLATLRDQWNLFLLEGREMAIQ